MKHAASHGNSFLLYFSISQYDCPIPRFRSSKNFLWLLLGLNLEIEMERRKVIKEKRQIERRRKAQHAKKMKHEARHRRRNYLKTKRELDHKNRRYKVIFHKGPIGMGIDPPEGHKIGSIVTVLVENGQADNSSKIRIGDAVISINGVDVTHLNHEDTYIELKYADRPMEIHFELAPYHPINKEDQKPLEKVFDEILESQSIKGLNIDELQEALAKSHIHVKKEDIKYILIRVKNDIDRDELSFEEFLHYSYDLSDEAKERKRHSHEYNEDHRESDTSEDDGEHFDNPCCSCTVQPCAAIRMYDEATAWGSNRG